MSDKVFVIVTSIAAPNSVMKALAQGCGKRGWGFVVIGDQKSPADFHIEGCDFYSLERQRKTGLRFAEICPVRHYARKTIGYLLAMRAGATVIAETDDDNIPQAGFWETRQKRQKAAVVEDDGWVNVYRYFSQANIWPRGFPLEELSRQAPAYEKLKVTDVDCPIQQGLADDNPDVDAVYRLTGVLPQKFVAGRKAALRGGAWCPFNSQNTTWWPEAFALLYLPAYCSFRMTDIWRSFVAQRIAHLNGWGILFHEATVRQQRNEHDLLRDFEDEIPGYLNNGRIREELEKLALKAGQENIAVNMRVCYEKLAGLGLVGNEESGLLDAWLGDIERIGKSRAKPPT